MKHKFARNKINKNKHSINNVYCVQLKILIIHVNDVVKAFYLSINKFVKNVVINIGSGRPRSVLDMVNILQGKKIFIPKRPGEPDTTHAKINKAQLILAWKPSISLETGLKDVLKNIDYWKKAPLWTKAKIKSATKNWFRYLK